MTTSIIGATDAPALVLSAADRNRLLDLANAALHRMPQVASLLLEEADRATVAPEHGQGKAVGLYSHVEYHDSETDNVQCVQIVYPHEANISEWKVSVLTLIGSGLIGLSEGQSILWPTRDGRRRTLSVLRVSAVPLRMPKRARR
jgi:regulator of nucleoside diphosphate kinase